MTRPGCCGWPATRGGWGSRSSRTRSSWPARRSRRRAGDGERRADRRRAAAARREPDPVAAFDALRELGLDEALVHRVRAGRSRARRAARWRCCPPTATGRRWSLAAARPASSGAGRWPRCSTGWPSRPRTATRSWPPRPGPARWRARSQAAVSPSEIAAGACGGGRAPSWWRWPGPRVRRRPRASGSTSLRHVELRDRRRRPARGRGPQRSGDRRGLAAALAAKLDGQAADRDGRARRRRSKRPLARRLASAPMTLPEPFYPRGEHFAIDLPGARRCSRPAAAASPAVRTRASTSGA